MDIFWGRFHVTKGKEGQAVNQPPQSPSGSIVIGTHHLTLLKFAGEQGSKTSQQYL
jgi:hypothetical protein